MAVSFDVNYRSKLWSVAKARSVLEDMIAGIDLLFCSKRDAMQVLEIAGEPDEIVRQVAERFGVRSMAMSDSENGVYGWENGRVTQMPAIKVDIVDRIGAGDALAAGIIHGWLDSDFATGLECGAIAAASAMSQNGDMLVINLEELNALYTHRGVQLSR